MLKEGPNENERNGSNVISEKSCGVFLIRRKGEKPASRKIKTDRVAVRGMGAQKKGGKKKGGGGEERKLRQRGQNSEKGCWVKKQKL